MHGTARHHKCTLRTYVAAKYDTNYGKCPNCGTVLQIPWYKRNILPTLPYISIGLPSAQKGALPTELSVKRRVSTKILQ